METLIDRTAVSPELSSTVQRLKKRLTRSVGQAIADFNMIEEGDTVLVCCSGGKDSYSLLTLLMAMRERAPVKFRLIAMNLDQKQPGFPADVLPRSSSLSASNITSLPKTLIPSSRKKSRKAKRPARFAPVCAAQSFIVLRANWERPRLPRAIIART